MKHTTLLLTVLVCFLFSSTAVLAKGPKEGKGSQRQSRRVVSEKGQKAEKKAKKEAEDAAEESAAQQAEAAKKKAEDKKKAGQIKTKGKDKALKDMPIAEQIKHEDQKHAGRQARLENLLAKAKTSGNEKLTQRIEKLMQKEQNRYQRKHQKMKQRQAGEKKLRSKDDDSD